MGGGADFWEIRSLWEICSAGFPSSLGGLSINFHRQFSLSKREKKTILMLLGGLEHEWIIFHFIYGRIFQIVNSRSTIYLVGGFKDLLFSIINGMSSETH